mgnify:CR=1 FL=1
MSKAYMEDKHIKEFYNEICIHQAISDHPSIMTLHHWFEDQKRFMIVTELSTGGELLTLMQQQKKFDVYDSGRILK